MILIVVDYSARTIETVWDEIVKRRKTEKKRGKLKTKSMSNILRMPCRRYYGGERERET